MELVAALNGVYRSTEYGNLVLVSKVVDETVFFIGPGVSGRCDEEEFLRAYSNDGMPDRVAEDFREFITGTR